MAELIFGTSPIVTIATNRFINVPIILQIEDTELIKIVKTSATEFTSEIEIYHSDGTYLTKAKGNRLYPTELGKKAGVTIEKFNNLWVCKMNGQILFEIQQQSGDAFKTTAELYAPEGYFVKIGEDPDINLAHNGAGISVGGVTMSNCTFQDVRFGIRFSKNGGVQIGGL